MLQRAFLVLVVLGPTGSTAWGQAVSSEFNRGDEVICLSDSATLTTDAKVVTKLTRGTVGKIQEIDKPGAKLLVRASLGKTTQAGWTSSGDWKILSSPRDRERLDELLRERILALRKRDDILNENFKDADGVEIAALMDLLIESKRELVKAQLEYTQSPVDRIQIREEFLERAHIHERTIGTWRAEGRRGGEDDKFAQATAIRAGAEIDLLRERLLAAKQTAGGGK